MSVKSLIEDKRVLCDKYLVNIKVVNNSIKTSVEII